MTEPTFSSAEVAAKLGVSERMLNYYIKTGKMRSQIGYVGSGHRRRWTLDEVRRLRQCLTRVRAAQQIIREWTSGQLWQDTT